MHIFQARGSEQIWAYWICMLTNLLERRGWVVGSFIPSECQKHDEALTLRCGERKGVSRNSQEEVMPSHSSHIINHTCTYLPWFTPFCTHVSDKKSATTTLGSYFLGYVWIFISPLPFYLFEGSITEKRKKFSS